MSEQAYKRVKKIQHSPIKSRRPTTTHPPTTTSPFKSNGREVQMKLIAEIGNEGVTYNGDKRNEAKPFVLGHSRFFGMHPAFMLLDKDTAESFMALLRGGGWVESKGQNIRCSVTLFNP